MLRNVQAFGVSAPNEILTAGTRLAAALTCVLLLAGCGTGGDKLSQDQVDQNVQTGALASAAPDSTQISDSATIRNAVSAADIEAMGSAPLAWANSDTGSRGTISSVAETRAAGVLCRKFTASRESYAGVGVYQGETCLDERGGWRMQEFKPLQ